MLAKYGTRGAPDYNGRASTEVRTGGPHYVRTSAQGTSVRFEDFYVPRELAVEFLRMIREANAKAEGVA